MSVVLSNLIKAHQQCQQIEVKLHKIRFSTTTIIQTIHMSKNGKSYNNRYAYIVYNNIRIIIIIIICNTSGCPWISAV